MFTGEQRTRIVGEMYEVFSDVIGLKREGHIDEKLAPHKIMGHLRELLGVQQLSCLRKAVVQAAIDTLARKA